MRVCRRLTAAFLVMVLCICVGITAYAEPGQTEEEAAEEQEKQLQEQVYNMAVQSNEWANWPKGPGTYGEAAIVMEVGTGAILYAKNVDEHEYPASITKVLTALIALENGQFSDNVTFSHECVTFMKPGDSSVGLKEGNVISLEQALYATLLASANEAAYAVGENVGKNAGQDYNWFVEQMNQRCQELGGMNSHFVNTNGLHDPEHYTCARDMALIGRELFNHPEFFTIVQTLNYVIPESATTEEHVFQQKHKMLIPGNANYYEYAVGGKTGYTSDALSTLITMADNGSMQLVCVVLRTHGANIYPDTRNLFEYAFQNFHKVSIAENEKSEDIQEILEDRSDGYVVLPDGVEFEDLEMQMIADDTISAEDETTLEYTYEGNVVGTARAKLRESYLDRIKADVGEVKTEDNEADDQKTEKTKNWKTYIKEILDKIKEKFQQKTIVEKGIIIGATGLLVVLVISLIVMVLKRK
ncbi:D-alanyl-D-alanine carboxypeptidase family protein [Faecalicatena contorta]|uniref:D-alanyl-D-alanine carboxypeptidase family protein n=1 Tax=Faecalicatena contorta TaxID=39482 RepID=UPI001F38F02A|nr:D-alanyl-D-alanine carboxypeptidase family protein [Faecalicatena contorta]MCF2682058.1 D-alanyl-D-alanine carboxypeptidase [Faecalicatena contorta]